jgi:Spy/CpxP family protein refolding chaperone
MKRSRIALIAACIVGTAGIAAAADSSHSAHAGNDKHHRHMRHHFGGEPPFARLIQKLDLTDEQRQSLSSLIESSKPQQEALREQHRETMKAAMTTLPDDPNYPALIAKRKELASASIQQRSDLNVQIFALLTPEQKAQVPALIEEMKTRAKQWRARQDKREETRL